MPEMKNAKLSVSMDGFGNNVVLKDLVRNEVFLLDEKTRFIANNIERHDHKVFSHENVSGKNCKTSLAGKGEAIKLGENTISCVHKTAHGNIILTWLLEADRVRIIAGTNTVNCASALALPGTFRLKNGNPFLSAVPNCQGVIHTGKGPAFFRPLFEAGHKVSKTLDMFAQLSEKSALLAISETDADAVLHWEKTEKGIINLMWVEHPSLGRLSYEREVVFMFTPPDITDVCKKYRAYEIEKGRFKTWKEKIAERPVLEKIFGAARVFIGYHQDSDLDYLDSFRRLKKLGIDKAIVYPVYLFTVQKKGKTPPQKVKGINIRNILPDLKKLGFSPGSFILVTEGPKEKNNKNDFLQNINGDIELSWQIKNQKWYIYENRKVFACAKENLDKEQRGLEMVHYDVLMSRSLRENYNPVLRSEARDDFEARKKIFEYTAKKQMYISSEGFCGRMAKYYDIGSTKYYNMLGGEEYCIVPMTMLVYHDSAYHTWWEVDNYNNPEHRMQGERGYSTRFSVGGGFPKLQSCVDAIMGVNPDIFPFGMQYNFVPHSSSIYYYKNRLESPLVQEAIKCAKPVMKLNKKIGKLELVDFRLHKSDGSLQESIFSDGTRVIANFSNVALEVPKAGLIKPETWITKS